MAKSQDLEAKNICCSSAKERKVGEMSIDYSLCWILYAFLEAVGMGFEENWITYVDLTLLNPVSASWGGLYCP